MMARHRRTPELLEYPLLADHVAASNKGIPATPIYQHYPLQSYRIFTANQDITPASVHYSRHCCERVVARKSSTRVLNNDRLQSYHAGAAADQSMTPAVAYYPSHIERVAESKATCTDSIRLCRAHGGGTEQVAKRQTAFTESNRFCKAHGGETDQVAKSKATHTMSKELFKAYGGGSDVCIQMDVTRGGIIVKSIPAYAVKLFLDLI
jgi:hypothetical protein